MTPRSSLLSLPESLEEPSRNHLAGLSWSINPTPRNVQPRFPPTQLTLVSARS
ncbi:hypothetical protein SCLCIDRAFT_1223545 [Scleroderma citrinum Foug A]|uniref:Uncharacterized protein n=1 Tax=Scleroderma citrinum Foug A TaxID=1036808 RepID=A0A0C2ZIN8_9AGAM|nr:hypothetical protein SCLCIDRAFT_1223545 [Scleroderma citrinum Foug A]